MIVETLIFCSLAVVQCEPTPEIVYNEIERQTKIYNVNTEDALRISDCESDFKWNAKSPISSATGVYQFIDSTWEYFCKGDRLDFTANIRCFMELYPKYPSYWECK